MNISTITGTLIQRKKPLDVPCPAFIMLEGNVARVADFSRQTEADKEAAFKFLNKVFDAFVLADADSDLRPYLISIACGRGCAHKLSPQDAREGAALNAAKRDEAVAHALATAAALGLESKVTCVSGQGSVYISFTAKSAVHTLRISDHIASDNGHGLADLLHYTWQPATQISAWLSGLAEAA